MQIGNIQWFPNITPVLNPVTPVKQIGIFFCLAVIFSLLGRLIPVDGFFAWDWVHFFGIGNVPVYYPPWTELVVRWLTYPILIGLSLAAVGLAAYLRSRHPLSLVCVFITLPVMWTLFLGQVDGLALLGVIGLPWLAPLALLKPQVSLWAFGARSSWLIALAISLLVSFVIGVFGLHK
jgi:hypothetical protein